MKDEKDKYEPPRAMRLTSLDAGVGWCDPGSGDAEMCYSPGSSASGLYGCDCPGSSASSCTYPGNSAA